MHPIYDRDYINFLTKALNSIQEGITIIDNNGYIRFINDSACNILGVKREEIIGKMADSFTRSKPMLLEIIANKKSIIDKEYFLSFKNKTIHLLNSGYPFFDENGSITGAIDIFQKIQRTRKVANTFAGYQAFFTFSNLIGENKLFKECIRIAKIFAKNDENLLILGESGTGKELFAQAIHNQSSRATQPFVALNCANFPNDLIDSELFGYEEGAFTGAAKGGKPGKFELAHGGTLFLDEIGEMPFSLQAKLLRVLETRHITRIGGNKLFRADVRIITATNRDLHALAQEGQFRSDLYYRLKILFLKLPSLRERKEDILILASHFLSKFEERVNIHTKGFTKGAKELMLNYNWPGNVRELENTISRTVFLNQDDYITKESLLRAGLDATTPPKFEKKITSNIKLSKETILEAMQQTSQNKKKAAELLGISRPTLYKLLKNLNCN